MNYLSVEALFMEDSGGNSMSLNMYVSIFNVPYQSLKTLFNRKKPEIWVHNH